MAKLLRLTKKFVLLCEGQHDSEFFTHLCSLHNLREFEIASANYVLGINRGGNSKFTDALDALVSVPGFSTVERILVVADNDLIPSDSFKLVTQQINATAEILSPKPHRFIAPMSAQIKAGHDPAIVILMLPQTGVAGSLDTMCLVAAQNANYATSICVDAFANCTKSDLWPETTLAKMKLRSFISVLWQDNPGLSPSYVWSQGTNIVPLTDPIFDDIVAFLKGFPTL